MIQIHTGRAGRLTIRISGFAAAAIAIVSAWAAIRSAAEWHGISTFAAIITFGSLCVFSALIAQYCLTREHETDDLEEEELEPDGHFETNIPGRD